MTTRTAQPYDVGKDPEMIKYWIWQGPRTAAFLLVIPGCTVMGCGLGLLLHRLLPFGVIGFGAGMLAWGLIVALGGEPIQRPKLY